MIGVCKFCKCTENSPCAIPCELDGKLAIGAGGLHNGRLNYLACAWLLDDVCTNPACVEAAYLEARPKVEELMQKLDMIFDVEAA